MLIIDQILKQAKQMKYLFKGKKKSSLSLNVLDL